MEKKKKEAKTDIEKKVWKREGKRKRQRQTLLKKRENGKDKQW